MKGETPLKNWGKDNQKSNKNLEEECQASQENQTKQIDEGNFPRTDNLNIIKKTQTGGSLEMENLDKWAETTDTSFTKRIQERRKYQILKLW